ncbi:MAG: M23 family metallopeptidase [Crocinitomicaceae bacterium]
MLAYFLGVSVFSSESKSLEREKLEAQSLQIDSLTQQIQTQEDYIFVIRKIVSGEIPVDTSFDSIPIKLNKVDLSKIETKETKEEISISKKVKSDLLTKNESQQDSKITYFASPVVGAISQSFDRKIHPGVDVVTEKDKVVKACLSGTIVYSGFTRKDGYLIIIDHGNKFLSVYKHNKRVLKKIGTKIQLGDPIAIVGDTGENSDGPHLHFELWLDQQPVDPLKYMDFKF